MRPYAPVLVLVLLAIAIPEVLFGSAPLNAPGRVLVNLPMYAGGAILVRELARRRKIGWPQLAMLGAAYGLIEEGLALESTFNPSLFNAGLVGGRLLGVNWTWTEWTLGYHAVWSISIPILLTELIFPARRAEPWLGNVGVVVAGLVYLAGVAFLGAIFRLVISPDFTPPTIPYLAAGAVAVGLAALALSRPHPASEREPAGTVPEPAPAPWLVGLLALGMSLGWFGLLLLPGPVKESGWVLVPMALDLALLAGLVTLVRRWSAAGRGWTDLHRLALAAGPLPASMLWGTVYVTAADPGARAGQILASGLAIVLLALLARRLHRRAGPRHPGGRQDPGSAARPSVVAAPG